jgi:hypothetical protein
VVLLAGQPSWRRGCWQGQAARKQRQQQQQHWQQQQQQALLRLRPPLLLAVHVLLHVLSLLPLLQLLLIQMQQSVLL